jgi:2-amino-4-hydroxy-6-hydroxymethyldihydropteridine diphosphokinase
MEKPATVYLSLGSNMGNRPWNLILAISLLDRYGVNMAKASLVYETEPWGVKNQSNYLNMAIKALTTYDPMSLLSLNKYIEKLMGRRGNHWEPRPIDIDILLYDDIVFQSEVLSIPHLLMLKRLFVLKPLCDIAPSLLIPGTSATVEEALSRCEDHLWVQCLGRLHNLKIC